MFRNRRRHRFLTALLVVMSLLFSQLALANYVCPGEQDGSAMAQRMAAGEPCQGMESGQTALCQQHATAASQAVDHLKVLTPTLPALAQALFLPVLDLAARAPTLPLSAQLEPHPPPGPLFLSTLRLRV